MATKIPWENEQEQNYICMDKIIYDIVCKELRSVFSHLVHGTTPMLVDSSCFIVKKLDHDQTRMSTKQHFNMEIQICGIVLCFLTQSFFPIQLAKQALTQP